MRTMCTVDICPRIWRHITGHRRHFLLYHMNITGDHNYDSWPPPQPSHRHQLLQIHQRLHFRPCLHQLMPISTPKTSTASNYIASSLPQSTALCAVLSLPAFAPLRLLLITLRRPQPVLDTTPPASAVCAAIKPVAPV